MVLKDSFRLPDKDRLSIIPEQTFTILIHIFTLNATMFKCPAPGSYPAFYVVVKNNRISEAGQTHPGFYCRLQRYSVY
jgi:hypothetical protein